MKKIKTLLTIPALVAVVPTTVSLSSCGGINKNDPVVDPSVSDKVSITITRNEDGSATCNLTTKSNLQKITDATVKIGDTSLTKGAEYSISDTNSSSTMIVMIFKAALEKYKGSIIITPVVEDKTFSGIIVELNPTTFYKDDVLTTSKVNVYKSYEGTKSGGVLSWDNLKISHNGEDITTTFKASGFTFTTVQKEKFVITYDKFTQEITIDVNKKVYTINCSVESGECLILDKKVVTAEEGLTWGSVKPTVSGNTDVDISLYNYEWQHEDGTLINDGDEINSSFNAKLVYSYQKKTPTIYPTPTICSTEGAKSTFGVACYVPSEWITSDNQYEYTFFFNNTSEKSGSFQYFWIALKTGEGTGRLFTIYKENIGTVSVGGETVTDWTLHSYNGGTYLKFSDEPVPTGDNVSITFRPAINSKTLIPAYEADGK